MSAYRDPTLDELGPVDYTVVEFPAGRDAFSGELADELLRLVDTDTVRLLDLLVVTKNLDGTLDAAEVADVTERVDVRDLGRYVAEILTTSDVEALGAALRPGSVAGIVVWENTWAAPFATAARRSGGQLVASGRIPIESLLSSLEDEVSGGAPQEREPCR